MLKNLEEKFNLYCNSNNLQINHNQIKVVKELNFYYKKNFRSLFKNFFLKDYPKKAFYLYGDVGVGKTMLLNFFFNLINQKKKRQHFN